MKYRIAVSAIVFLATAIVLGCGPSGSPVASTPNASAGYGAPPPPPPPPGYVAPGAPPPPPAPPGSGAGLPWVYRPSRAVAAQPPLFESPDAVYAASVDAARTGNFDSYASCFTTTGLEYETGMVAFVMQGVPKLLPPSRAPIADIFARHTFNFGDAQKAFMGLSMIEGDMQRMRFLVTMGRRIDQPKQFLVDIDVMNKDMLQKLAPGADVTPRSNIRNLRVEGDFATAEVYSLKTNTGFPTYFSKIGGTWLIDCDPQHPLSDRGSIQRTFASPEEVIASLNNARTTFNADAYLACLTPAAKEEKVGLAAYDICDPSSIHPTDTFLQSSKVFMRLNPDQIVPAIAQANNSSQFSGALRNLGRAMRDPEGLIQYAMFHNSASFATLVPGLKKLPPYEIVKSSTNGNQATYVLRMNFGKKSYDDSFYFENVGGSWFLTHTP